VKSKKFKVTLTAEYVTHDTATQGGEHSFFQEVLKDATSSLERLVLRGDLRVEEIKEEK
jgi:hypothetical protein